MKSLFKLFFACVFLLFGTSVFAQSEVICSGTTFPSGYVATNTLYTPSCGTTTFGNYNSYYLQAVSSSTTDICAGTTIPSGWQQVGGTIATSQCQPIGEAVSGATVGYFMVAIEKIPTPVATPVTCSLSLSIPSATAVNPNLVSWGATYSLTFSINSPPAGVSAHWYGTEDGVADAGGTDYINLFQSTNTFTYSNSVSGMYGNYVRYIVFQAGNTVLCTTNSVTFILDPNIPLRTPGPQKRP
ncbi:MAG: hypothetical protein P4L91_05980 [Burkholderiaceae bacterium]|nr:hypothetical protein [Burkholderiaceae bacterium]